MPYKSDKIKLPREYDRRVKYDDNDKKKIHRLHKQGYSQRAIAREIPCSRRYVIFTIYPERLARQKELFKERQSDGRYKYTKERWAEIMREHRHYKHNLLKTNKIWKHS